VNERSQSEPPSADDALGLLELHFFAGSEPDERQRRSEAFLENAIRLVVLDTQLAIDELLRSHVFDALASHSELSVERRVTYVKELTSRQVLDLAVQLGITGMARYRKLRDLNALRNNAAHHWQLDEPLRHRSGAAAQEHPLTWEGRRLTPETVRTRFTRVYGAIYEDLFQAWMDAHHAERDDEASGTGSGLRAPGPRSGSAGASAAAGGDDRLDQAGHDVVDVPGGRDAGRDRG